MDKIGIFAGSLLITVIAVYFYSPVLGLFADETASVKVNINPVSSLWMDNNYLNFDITPTDNGVHTAKVIEAYSFTNSNAGHEIYFSSVDDSTDMTHRNPSVHDVISSNFSGSIDYDKIPLNSWGYSVDGTYKLQAVPPASAAIKAYDSGAIVGEHRTDLRIGVRVSNGISSGYYSKDVRFSMITHEPMIPIQEFDCSSIEIGDEVRLTDMRDMNQYMVAKLNDGRCWMTENLRLKNKTITNEDSDISAASYTVPDSSETMINSLTDPALYDTGNTSYGVYYNYVATSAGTITTMNNGNTLSESICPKGWTIPSHDDWLALFNVYSITNDLAGSTILRATPINMVYSGLYSNDTDEGGLGVLSQGEAGLYWSTQTSYTLGRRESTYISDTSATIYHALYRYNGVAIRCIRRNS
ncbi:fibrobacter succinogenes major paralogous domain-containing protein [Candidatus Saccharibacteria bacterium]|nr:fibrobacter succinogenes major paralogous domain-containing protein [Candidatus Saccharibacteria bacterium]